MTEAEASAEVGPALAPRDAQVGDRKLIAMARSGSREALEQLAARHWDDAYRTALMVSSDPSSAEDIAQEAFIAAVESLSRFDTRRSFAPWLHRIVTNKAIDHTRSRRRRPPPSPRGDAAASDSPPDLDPALAEALARLSAADRAIVVLRHLFDYSSREIGRQLGLPAGTVRRRLQGALEQMRSELRGDAEHG